MRIVCDDMILGAEEAFAMFGDLELRSAVAINEMSWSQIDVLLVRSQCPVSKENIQNSQLQFVGTASAGFDHFDVAALNEAGIRWSNAPGCNAESVVDFVLACLCDFAIKKETDFRSKTVGIVGCGQIGSRLLNRLEMLGAEVLVCDPPLKEENTPGSDIFIDLDELLVRSDIVSLHVPLTSTGTHKTHQMIGPKELSILGSKSWLISSCRGGVISELALKNAQMNMLGLDVWENEPRIDSEIVDIVDIATAHIAGHSIEGKLGGTIALVRQLEKICETKSEWNIPRYIEDNWPVKEIPAPETTRQIFHFVRDAFGLLDDDRALRKSLLSNSPTNKFRIFRSEYKIRHDFQSQVIGCQSEILAKEISNFGFSVNLKK